MNLYKKIKNLINKELYDYNLIEEIAITLVKNQKAYREDIHKKREYCFNIILNNGRIFECKLKDITPYVFKTTIESESE
jgi:hypothetical protein